MICTNKQNNKSRKGGTFIYFASLRQKTVKCVPCWAIFHQSLRLAPAPGAFYPVLHQSTFMPTCCNLKKRLQDFLQLILSLLSDISSVLRLHVCLQYSCCHFSISLLTPSPPPLLIRLSGQLGVSGSDCYSQVAGMEETSDPGEIWVLQSRPQKPLQPKSNKGKGVFCCLHILFGIAEVKTK